ncbi:hypothetical protein AAG570_008475 [Ranatra chinensis]|uniref:RNA exonuclease 4 n=1 Tax=Ranatra chinensis TaxID=642074 RepID=A0ABD0YRL9_9HEMI
MTLKPPQKKLLRQVAEKSPVTTTNSKANKVSNLNVPKINSALKDLKINNVTNLNRQPTDSHDRIDLSASVTNNSDNSSRKKKKRKKKILAGASRSVIIKKEDVENKSTTVENKPVSLAKKSNDTKKVNNVADITHKKVTGDCNWNRFLKEQNISSKLVAVVHRKENKNCTKAQDRKVDCKEVKRTKVVGLDCEMVGIGDYGREHMLARVSVVNEHGDCLYDRFVKPRERVVNYRTFVSGVRPEDIENGDDFETVQKAVAEIIKGRRLVGHALRNDLSVLHLSHPKWDIRDTSRFFREQGKGTPGLKKLALEHLGLKIQEGEHSSVQDAQAAVQLYNMYRKQWESGGGNRAANRLKVGKKSTVSHSNLIHAADV